MFTTLVGVATILGALAEMAVLALIVCDRNKKTEASGEEDESDAVAEPMPDDGSGAVPRSEMPEDVSL